jgi:hypothetical protein
MTHPLSCPKCSCDLPAEANFCRRCGSATRARPTAVASYAPARKTATPGKKSGGGIWVLIVLAYFGFRFYNATHVSQPILKPYIPPAAWKATSLPSLSTTTLTPPQSSLGTAAPRKLGRYTALESALKTRPTTTITQAAR